MPEQYINECKKISVSQRFNAFLQNIKITYDQAEDERTKHAGVRKCLNRHYWNSASETANSMLVGSAGKSTRVRRPRDIDLMFILPDAVYAGIEWQRIFGPDIP